MSERRTLKARLVNLTWRALGPGSHGQRVVRWLAALALICIIIIAVSIRF